MERKNLLKQAVELVPDLRLEEFETHKSGKNGQCDYSLLAEDL
jgi:hypothetical protein